MKQHLDNIAWAASLWAVGHTLPAEVGAGLAACFLALALWGAVGRWREWRGRKRRVRDYGVRQEDPADDTIK